jgi:hypothetical protein
MKKTLKLESLAIKSFKTSKTADIVVKGGGAPSYLDWTFCHTNCSCPIHV